MTEAEITKLHNETADLQDRIEARCKRLASIQGMTRSRAARAVIFSERPAVWFEALFGLSQAVCIRNLGPNCIETLRMLDCALEHVIDRTIPGGSQKEGDTQ